MKKTLFLMVLMLLLLTSCAKDAVREKDRTVNGDIADTADIESGDIFAEREAVKDGLGDEWDFGGRTLRVACHGDGYEMFPKPEEINKGDLIKDAKAKRNQAVESRLNVNIELAYSAGIVELQPYIEKTILSGSDEFDLIVNHVLVTGGMATKSLFQNWYDVPHIDFTKPWWAASNQTELTYDGKCIIAFSDINATSITSTCVIAFNKELAAAYDLGDLYGYVLSGEWTYDKMYSLIKDIYVDEDGSGTPTAGDFYGGVFGIGDPTNAWIWAFDNPIVKKDGDGIPKIAVKTDKINSIMQTLYDFYYNNKGIANQYTVEDISTLDSFTNKKAIMVPIALYQVAGEQLRNFEDDYGILPYPKWDDHQKDYISHVFGELTCLTVPKTAKDLEFIGVCTEALSYESWKTLTPTVYELALKTRYLRDSESKAILDIIIDNRFFDFGFVYDNWQGFAYIPMNMLKNKTYNFESYYSKSYNSARIQLKKVIRAFDKLA